MRISLSVNFLRFLLILGCLCDPISQVLAQGRFDRPTFFRDGQLLMEQEIQRLQQQPETPATEIEHPAQILTIDSGQLQWQKFLFRDGNFSVWMPQGIQSLETIILDLGKSNLSFEVFATQPKPYRFVAAYSEDLSSSQLANPTQLLLAVREGIVKQTNFILLTDKDITWQQYLGQELTMKHEDELISFRVYLINQKIYVLAAGQNNNVEQISTNILSFFDSFRLLN
ncbi:hypothetical protein VB715_07805 [Crocosphaera sp. UHCC 0190]|uniref:hypothetical protein n=1 Tax=Crocosphaera sp. UHCC 0190 TaxID=3110246 RepID=UPI002B1F0386|nr:hypothetical protein [Crocosphaera sp. UHCC 0190]MEA5509666.1 hypothetical protein [Crocosphaera sp. UHCC 0190]